jgi:hypothetical protein
MVKDQHRNLIVSNAGLGAFAKCKVIRRKIERRSVHENTASGARRPPPKKVAAADCAAADLRPGGASDSYEFFFDTPNSLT